MKRIAVLLVLLSPSSAWAEFTQWSPAREVAAARDVSMTLNVAGDTHFGFRRAWIAAGKFHGARTTTDVTYTVAYFAGERFFGSLRISEAIHKIGWVESTATQRAKVWAYWRDKIIDPSNSGTFAFRGVELKWIAFPHRDAWNREYQCANFTADGRGERFQVYGYWCAQGQRQLYGEDVRSVVNAVGYKDILSPQPITALPGL